MKEIEKNIRELVIETLKLLSSKDSQLKYQKDVPIADVNAELFCQWEGAYIPESECNINAFSKEEIANLNQFHEIFQNISDRTPSDLPPIEDFVETKEWKELSLGAKKALEIFKKK